MNQKIVSMSYILLIPIIVFFISCKTSTTTNSEKPGQWIDNHTYQVHAIGISSSGKNFEELSNNSQSDAVKKAQEQILEDFANQRLEVIAEKGNKQNLKAEFSQSLKDIIFSGSVVKINWSEDKKKCFLTYEAKKQNLKKFVVVGQF